MKKKDGKRTIALGVLGSEVPGRLCPVLLSECSSGCLHPVFSVHSRHCSRSCKSTPPLTLGRRIVADTTSLSLLDRLQMQRGPNKTQSSVRGTPQRLGPGQQVPCHRRELHLQSREGLEKQRRQPGCLGREPREVWYDAVWVPPSLVQKSRTGACPSPWRRTC